MDGRYSIEFGELIEERYVDRPFGELLDACEAIEDLSQHPGWVLLSEMADRLNEQKSRALRILPAKEPSEYGVRVAQTLGFLNGLGVFFDAAATFREKTEEIRKGEAGLVPLRGES